MNFGTLLFTTFIIGAFIMIITAETPEVSNTPEENLNQLIYQDINKKREQHNLPPLSMIPDFNQIAKQQSTKMQKEQLLHHSNAAFLNLGENVAQIPQDFWIIGCPSTLTKKGISTCATKTWMESPGHKANILKPDYTMTGIHAECDGTNCWITQNFK